MKKPKGQAKAAPKKTTIPKSTKNWKILPGDTPAEVVVDKLMKGLKKKPAKPRAKKAKPPQRVARQLKAKEKEAAAKRAKTPKAPEEEPIDDARPLTTRQENFCLFFVEEPTAVEAYRRAYGNTKTPDAAASRLLTSVKIQKRIVALRQAAASTAVLSLQEKRSYLRRVVLTPIGDIDERSDLCQSYERNEMGGPRGKLKRGNADQGNEEDEPEYEVVKIRIADKLRAIELDARLAGEFAAEKHEHSVDDELADLLGAIRAGK